MIHPTALIGKNVIIGNNVSVGAYSVIDNAIIMHNVEIGNGCVIGKEGFNFYKDETGLLKRKPHKQMVFIGIDVVIGANTTIDRGLRRHTTIGRGTIINAQCHIAHDCIIGDNNILPSGVILGGFVKTGNDVKFGMGVIVHPERKIADRVFVGMGSIVIRDVTECSTIAGNPAKTISKRGHDA